jgi:hypothetical protein
VTRPLFSLLCVERLLRSSLALLFRYCFSSGIPFEHPFGKLLPAIAPTIWWQIEEQAETYNLNWLLIRNRLIPNVPQTRSLSNSITTIRR